MATEEKQIIEPERFGLWIAATFILALLALGVSLVAIYRIADSNALIQAELLILNKKIESPHPQ